MRTANIQQLQLDKKKLTCNSKMREQAFKEEQISSLAADGEEGGWGGRGG
jgi:hypothetical protein